MLHCNNSRPTRKPTSRRRGAAAAEFAMCSWLLVVLVLGMMEIGRALNVKEGLTDVARYGARVAALPGTSYSQVTSATTTALQAAFGSGSPVATNATVTVETSAGPGAGTVWTYPATTSFSTTTDLSTTKRGDALRVSVKIDVKYALWIYGTWMTAGELESEKCVMMRQG